MDYRLKYLKYKNKYLNLKIQSGGVGIKNACIALYYKTPTHNFIYLIKGNDDNWNIPGGRIDDKENSLEAAFREFKEETGGFLLDKWAPRTNQQRKFYKYEFREHTAIWWCVSYEEPKIIFKPNREATEGGWFDINELNTIPLRFSDSVTQITGILRTIGILS